MNAWSRWLLQTRYHRLDDEMLRPAWRESGWSFVGANRDFKGMLIHFRAVDDEYELPPGTAKRLLPQAATSRYWVKIEQQTANTIRFRRDEEAYNKMITDHEAEREAEEE